MTSCMRGLRPLWTILLLVVVNATLQAGDLPFPERAEYKPNTALEGPCAQVYLILNTQLAKDPAKLKPGLDFFAFRSVAQRSADVVKTDRRVASFWKEGISEETIRDSDETAIGAREIDFLEKADKDDHPWGRLYARVHH